MYEAIEPKLGNTVFKARKDKDNNIISYRISPADGYKLHEISLDVPVLEEETHKETGEVRLGFTKSYVTAGANYNFEKNERRIYAEKEV